MNGKMVEFANSYDKERKRQMNSQDAIHPRDSGAFRVACQTAAVNHLRALERKSAMPRVFQTIRSRWWATKKAGRRGILATDEHRFPQMGEADFAAICVSSVFICGCNRLFRHLLGVISSASEKSLHRHGELPLKCPV